MPQGREINWANDADSETFSKCTICPLNRYAYEEGADDEEEIALTSAPKKSSGEEKPVNTDVFSLDDDVEEGKLE